LKFWNQQRDSFYAIIIEDRERKQGRDEEECSQSIYCKNALHHFRYYLLAIFGAFIEGCLVQTLS
jgi:hypothetical protein